jgi:hypothetical protein
MFCAEISCLVVVLSKVEGTALVGFHVKQHMKVLLAICVNQKFM